MIYRENVDDAAYGPYWCLVNTSSNTAATVSNTARIEQSVRTPSPVAVPKGGAIVNGGRLEGIVNLKVCMGNRLDFQFVCTYIHTLTAEMELVTYRNERYGNNSRVL